MTTILSSGYGRLHLAQSAEYLGRAGVDVKLVCGWVPKNPDSWLVRLCSKIVGRNLAPGLRKRLIVLGKDEILDGKVSEIGAEILKKQGFDVEIYEPYKDNLHGTAKISKDRLTLYLANYEQASNQTAVRIDWCKKHALDGPRFLNEEPCVFVSLANPYLLQDVPRVKTYINAYTATRTVIETVIDKLMHGGPFTGVSPVDAFCGLPDTRL